MEKARECSFIRHAPLNRKKSGKNPLTCKKKVVIKCTILRYGNADAYFFLKKEKETDIHRDRDPLRGPRFCSERGRGRFSGCAATATRWRAKRRLSRPDGTTPAKSETNRTFSWKNKKISWVGIAQWNWNLTFMMLLLTSINCNWKYLQDQRIFFENLAQQVAVVKIAELTEIRLRHMGQDRLAFWTQLSKQGEQSWKRCNITLSSNIE